jgi:hypothetical protein
MTPAAPFANLVDATQTKERNAMARSPDTKEAEIHAEAIIAATLASAVMITSKAIYTQHEAIQQHKLMLNSLRAAGAFDPISLPGP